MSASAWWANTSWGVSAIAPLLRLWWGDSTVVITARAVGQTGGPAPLRSPRVKREVRGRGGGPDGPKTKGVPGAGLGQISERGRAGRGGNGGYVYVPGAPVAIWQ